MSIVYNTISQIYYDFKKIRLRYRELGEDHDKDTIQNPVYFVFHPSLVLTFLRYELFNLININKKKNLTAKTK